VTIVLPNLIDRFPVAICDIEDFVATQLGRSVDVKIVHLLIYLFWKSSDPQVGRIQNLRLIHRGRIHSIMRPSDLQARLPLLKDEIDMFPTFQLMVSPAPHGLPFDMSIDAMILKVGTGAQKNETPSVTYAEAMAKFFRQKTRRLSA
ncbi:hypothetical protein METBIDRAFT_18839, partial [Metschnikowia bicuspidata var. bicuspidata NRRL YB-4993]